MSGERSLLSPPMSIAAGFIATWGALALGLFGGGPLLRFIWGPPTGVGEDYTTWQGCAQATIAQTLFMIPAFALCGRFLRKLRLPRPGWLAAMLIANPLNVLAGYWFYYKVFYTGQNLDVDLPYFRLGGQCFWVRCRLWSLRLLRSPVSGTNIVAKSCKPDPRPWQTWQHRGSRGPCRFYW